MKIANVIEINDGQILSLESWPFDNGEFEEVEEYTVKAAEVNFIKKAREMGFRGKADSILAEGRYAVQKYEVIIRWSDKINKI